jgi:undecaprenyl phosphate-alpha-L-ara4N flippase subunit ArnE
MNAMTIVLVFLTNLFFAASSVFFKIAVDKVGKFDLTSLAAFMPIALRFLISQSFLLGVASSVVGSGCYYLMLARFNLSIAYPLLSLAYVFVAVASIFFLKESLSLSNWIGIALICAGVALVSLKLH